MSVEEIYQEYLDQTESSTSSSHYDSHTDWGRDYNDHSDWGRDYDDHSDWCRDRHDDYGRDYDDHSDHTDNHDDYDDERHDDSYSYNDHSLSFVLLTNSVICWCDKHKLHMFFNTS